MNDEPVVLDVADSTAWREAAEKLFAARLREGFSLSALHFYRSADGAILYARARLHRPGDTGKPEKFIRPFWRDGERWLTGEPKLTTGKPLYGLCEVLAAPDAHVIVCEGEQKVDALTQTGAGCFVGVTSGSATSAGGADWTPLAGRDVIMWPDNDMPGQKYADEVAALLCTLGCKVERLDVSALGLGESGDVIDWLAQSRSTSGREPGADDVLALPRVPKPPPACQADGEEDGVDNGDSEAGGTPPGFAVRDDGVFYEDDDGVAHRICSPLRVTALVRDASSENWGRLLEWRDADGVPHRWAMPMELLGGDGADMRGELARLGLDIAPGMRTRQRLAEYITNARPEKRARCVTRTGWHQRVFVLPERTIGESPEHVIYQADVPRHSYAQAGTLAEWQEHVARFCVRNSRLLLAVSAAFASMLVHVAGQESGGLNFVGVSSSGKTATLRTAASVFGGPDYLCRWRSTANGLEALAATHNDTLLVLDELAQVDPREAGEACYLLANGSGKARAARSGLARPRQAWRLLFLSAGEVGLAQHMREAGKKTRAGQEVRLVDIAADAGAGYGVFEELHGMAGGADLSDLLIANAATYYGTAAPAFLEAATGELDALAAVMREAPHVFAEENLPEGAGGQVQRVCQRFALAAFAGEYATANGITGWPEGAARDAAARCFRDWLESRGGLGDLERAAILGHVKAYFESHEEGRFTNLDAPDDRPTINRAGFRRGDGHGGVEYLVLPEVYNREICSGFDSKAVSKVLIDAGWIRPAPDGRSQRSERIPGKGTTRVYVITSAMWKDEA